MPKRCQWLFVAILGLLILGPGGGKAWAQSSPDRVFINEAAVSDQTPVVEAYVSVLDSNGRSVTGLSSEAHKAANREFIIIGR